MSHPVPHRSHGARAFLLAALSALLLPGSPAPLAPTAAAEATARGLTVPGAVAIPTERRR